MTVNDKAFYDALGQRESSNDYSAENQYGYLGKYQMGEMALIDAGYYNKDSDMYKNDWIGTWNYGIQDKNDFLNNYIAQEDTVRKYHDKAWNYVKSVWKYDGQTIDGHKITVSGMLAAAHLVGHVGLKKFLDSGGSIIEKDGNGVPITHYLDLLSGYETKYDGDYTIGDDILNGGNGKDIVYGGTGEDTINGGADGDFLYGGANNDIINGDEGNDTIYGGSGDDTIDGGDDVVITGSGNNFRIIDNKNLRRVA